MDDFVYVIAISAIAGANRSAIKAAAYKAASNGSDLAATSEAARKAAAEDGSLTAAVQIVVRLASIAGHATEGPRKRAIAAANAAAKAEKARAVESGASDEEARAFAAVKATEAYAAALPQRMRETLDGRRIPAPIVITVNGGELSSVDGEALPVLGASIEGLLRRFGAEVCPSFAAAATSIVTSGGHILPEIIPAKKPAGVGPFDAQADVAWANEQGHVVSGIITGYKPVNGYRIEINAPDIIGGVGNGLDGLVAVLTSGKIVVKKTTIYDGAISVASAADIAAKAKAAKAANIVSVEDAINAAFALRSNAPTKAKPKAKPRPRK